ncbi:MAG: nuclear transport factor 2 family protein [Solirubrobacteraceae bacterium]
MTATNVELVRSIYESWEAGDFSRAGQWADPEIEVASFGGPVTGGFVGAAAIEQGWQALLDTLDDVRPEAQEYKDIDDERVLVLSCLHGREKGNGEAVEQLRANLFRIRDGKVVRLIFYWSRDRALADVGLRPDGSSF